MKFFSFWQLGKFAKYKELQNKGTNCYLFTIQNYGKSFEMIWMKYFAFISPKHVRWEHHPCIFFISIFLETVSKDWKYFKCKIQWILSNTTVSYAYCQLLLYQYFDIWKESCYYFSGCTHTISLASGQFCYMNFI